MNHKRGLACFGDSITEGWMVKENQSWPWLIAQSLPFPVYNRGISGETSVDGIRRISEIIALEPAWCIVEFGINDFFNGFSAEETETNIDNIVITLKNSAIKPGIMGFRLPYEGADRWYSLFLRISERHRIPLMQDLFQGLWNRNGVFMPDGLHPTAKGYSIIAEQCLRTFSGTLWPK